MILTLELSRSEKAAALSESCFSDWLDEFLAAFIYAGTYAGTAQMLDNISSFSSGLILEPDSLTARTVHQAIVSLQGAPL